MSEGVAIDGGIAVAGDGARAGDVFRQHAAEGFFYHHGFTAGHRGDVLAQNIERLVMSEAVLVVQKAVVD